MLHKPRPRAPECETFAKNTQLRHDAVARQNAQDYCIVLALRANGFVEPKAFVYNFTERRIGKLSAVCIFRFCVKKEIQTAGICVFVCFSEIQTAGISRLR